MEKLGSGDPQRIGSYRLLGRLGSGGMGQVFLARSDRGRTVALKLVRPELAAQQHFRDRFRAEVQAARRVGGSWTAPVLDAGVDAAVPWVATGYIAGPSLHTVVSGRTNTAAPAPAPAAYGPLPERSVRILGAGLAEALQDIQRAGLIHRDLKPSNVLMTIDGPRVIDFGIARALDLVSDGGLTRTGSMVGSPGFMAPEQVRGDRLTPACDVFCLGSVLVYAATGRLPFGTAEGGAHALMFRIAEGAPDLTGVPVGLAELIEECLAKDPAARPSADTLLEEWHDPDVSEPWLPGVLIAQLGRHAVELLDYEDPSDEVSEVPMGDGGTVADHDRRAPSEPPPAASPHPSASRTATPHPSTSRTATPHPSTPADSSAPESTPPVPAQTVAGSVAAPSASATESVSAPGSTPAPAPAPAVPIPIPASAHRGVEPVPASTRAIPTALPAPHDRTARAPWPAGPHGHPQPLGSTHSMSTAAPCPPGTQEPERPAPPGEGDRRGRAGSVLVLAMVALLVALGTGWGVYGLLSGGHDDTTGSHTGEASPSEVGSSGDSGGSGKGSSGGVIPSGFLGSWTGTVQGDGGASARRLSLSQGSVGDPVLTLTAEGPLAGGGSYRCVFRASLANEPSSAGPVRIGPSRVVEGEPMSSCTPGEATVLALLPDGTLRREITSTGQSLTYEKSGQDAAGR
ncbi:protein kinase [Streptomyces sp. NPDC059166]|uniref:protein kinase domain-containing protein n=1 Tax=Streptomyces sp. NPDC059166 TaxID=3346752 RepID=UPI0036C40064